MSESTGVTYQQACEAITRWLKAERDVDVAPEAVFNFSPTGELWHVSALYQEAKAAGYGVNR